MALSIKTKILALLCLLMTGFVANSQIQIGNDLSDIDYSLPREYEIAGLTVSGAKYVDASYALCRCRCGGLKLAD